MTIFLLVVAISAFLSSDCSIFAWKYLLDDDSPPIPLSQLMILTVADLSSEEVTRDALTFLRSIQIFGGNLNQATTVLGFTGIYDNYGIDTLPLSTLSQFALYNVEFEFISVAESRFARNMNKLSSFSLFDPVRFAYLLWLDADILILQDPSPYLHQHRHPGAIKCVPEFYNYMIRYPSINSSSLFWNPALPSFHLVGFGEVAPAGTCNTGILLLDTYTVLKLHTRAMKALEEDVIPTELLHDRFLDSLIFVYAVNNESINMQLFPQTMNYMTFFEGEIIAAFDPPPVADDIVLAHMLWTTEFHCHLAVNESTSAEGLCYCTFINEHYNENSALSQALRGKITRNDSACRALAVDPAPNAAITPEISTRSDSSLPLQPYPCANNSEDKMSSLALDCSLLWPRTDTTEEEIHMLLTPQQALITDIFITCDFNAMSHELSRLSYNDPLTVKGRVHYRRLTTTTEEEVWTRYPEDFLFAIDDTNLTQQSNHYSTNKMTLKASVTMFLQDPLVQQSMKFFLSVALVSSQTEENQCIAIIIYPFTKLIVFQSLLPASQLLYSRNQLIGQKPLSLATQLLLPEFLQVHHLHRGKGIVFCCETNKGVQTVQRLVAMSKNAYLLIFVINIPSDYRLAMRSDDGTDREADGGDSTVTMQMQGMLGQACQDSGRNRCKVILAAPTHRVDGSLPKVLTRLRRHWYDFVYFDASWQQSKVLDEVLKQCHEALKTGGLFIGSQYWSPPPLFMSFDGLQVQPFVRIKTDKVGEESDVFKGSLPIMRIRSAVDKLSYNSNAILLQTHSESQKTYCDKKEKCWPAWYFFKMQ